MYNIITLDVVPGIGKDTTDTIKLNDLGGMEI